jgi:hypothetical protein
VGLLGRVQHRRAYGAALIGPLSVEAVPYAGLTVGTILDLISGGSTVRLGFGLQPDWSEPRIPSTRFLHQAGQTSGWPEWLEFGIMGAVEGRAVARNFFLDGNLFTSSHDVPKNWLVGDLVRGWFFRVSALTVGYQRVRRSSEFEGGEAHTYGSWTIAFGGRLCP